MFASNLWGGEAGDDGNPFVRAGCLRGRAGPCRGRRVGQDGPAPAARLEQDRHRGDPRRSVLPPDGPADLGSRRRDLQDGRRGSSVPICCSASGTSCWKTSGMSATTKLAPKAFASQTMALWFLSLALANGIQAQIVKLYGEGARTPPTSVSMAPSRWRPVWPSSPPLPGSGAPCTPSTEYSHAHPHRLSRTRRPTGRPTSPSRDGLNCTPDLAAGHRRAGARAAGVPALPAQRLDRTP